MKKHILLFIMYFSFFIVSNSYATNRNAVFKGKNKTTIEFHRLNPGKWLYNEEDKVFYQLDLFYCANPADEKYEKLAIFVPEAYFNSKINKDGVTYNCKINRNATINQYTAKTAPIVMSINTPGYMACTPLKKYQSFKKYTDAGFIYVYAGCRGREHGAPSGIVDLKAAVRYLRFTSRRIPGNTERIFTFGMSGGGAQSVLMGSTGDNELYFPYLREIGAVMGISDSVYGSMGWCPITNLDYANEAYEWNMGNARTGLNEFQSRLSKALAAEYANYVNNYNFTDEDGKSLTLSQSSDGFYHSGSYYDYVKSEIEHSLNNFLADIEFPFNADEYGKDMQEKLPADFRGFPESNKKPNFEEIDNIERKTATNGITISGTYKTVNDYINALNANGTWINYNGKTNKATITSVSDFVKALKQPTKSVGAFDDLNRTQGENILFGYGDGKGAHFDNTMAKLLKNTEYEKDFASDLARKDNIGNTIQTRIEMYTPLYFLMPSYYGYNRSKVARCWRIRSGINQGDTSVTTEINLALALKQNKYVKSVDYDMVWGFNHFQAERCGANCVDNFIKWVNNCMKE